MTFFSYRNKQRAKTFLKALLIAIGAVLLFCIGRFFYVQRYLVYTSNGVYLDYEQDLHSDRNASTRVTADDFPVTILLPEDSTASSAQVSNELRQLSGCYITTSMLQDLPAVQEALAEYNGTPTYLFQMKSIYGYFYYDTAIPGSYTANIDITALKNMISGLSEQDGTYLIASIPAFSDPNYALAYQKQALPLASGALWMDSNGCYWLDPMEEDVQSYLVTIAEELSLMGFDEVVFTGFRMPDSEKIVYTQEYTRAEAVIQAAQAIDESLEEVPIRVCFEASDPLVAAYSDRVYLSADSGSTVSSVVEPFQEVLTDTAAQIVFLTASRDTRFNQYGILRPLIEEDA